MPVPAAVRSKAWVCGRSPAEIVDSNPTGGIDVCFLCCVLSNRGLCDWQITRPEESYRLWYIVVCDPKNIMNEEALPHCAGGGGGVWPKTPNFFFVDFIWGGKKILGEY